MQQIPLYAMALMIPPGFDNIAHYGGRGASRMVAVYTENGITYVPKLADEPIDEAVEAVRASVLTHDPVIAQAIIDADAPYVFHEADELYKKRYNAIYPGTGNDLAKAKLITGEIADHCPLLLANPQLVTRELSEVLAGMPDAIKRKAFLEALDGFGDIGKLTTFVDDLANAPELVVALKGRWELVRAWEGFATSSDDIVRALKTDVPHLERYVTAFVREGDSHLAQMYSRLIALRPSARELLVNEDILIDASYGLQSSKSELFQDVILSEHSDIPLNRYLYTIDNRGINIGWEATPFPTPRGNIVHSNLSSEAYIGGEAWFGPNSTVTINAGSGRFGDGAGITEGQWEAAIDFWENLGYNVIPVPYGQRQL